MSNTKTIRMMESYITYENHGDVTLNLDYFPELQGKTDEEIQVWLNQNYSELYIDVNTDELRKNNKIVYEEEDIKYYNENPDEKPESDIDEDVIELGEYWNDTEVVWDKIKCEERNMFVQ